MSETYRLMWSRVPIIKQAIEKAEKVMLHVNYCHIETDDFDLDFDNIGVVIRIPHDRILTEERKLDHENKR
ncbi:hypothetical protein ES702_06599 [subsurface metagenome]